MLTSVDESLEAFLRAAVPLSAVDIDVSFEAPDDEWSAKLTRPTVNVHLWDVRRTDKRSIAGMETVERPDGTVIRRLALPRIDMRYVMTVWTSDPGDERALLGAGLIALLAHDEIPAPYVSRSYGDLPPISLEVARSGDTDVRTFDDKMKLALQFRLTAVVDTGAGVVVGPPVEALEIGFRDLSTQATDAPPRRIAGEVRVQDAVGATVRSPRGTAIVNESGRFLIAAQPGDEIVLETTPPVTVVVPPEGGVVVGA